MPYLTVQDTQKDEIENESVTVSNKTSDKPNITYPITKGPNASPSPSARKTPLTPCSLNIATCSGESVTPAGGPLMFTR